MTSRRTQAAAVATAAMLAAVAGCNSHPLVPPAVTHHPSAPATPAVAAGSDPAVGVDLYVPQSYPLATVRADGARDLAYIRSLHATSVGLVWNLYSPGAASDRVERTRVTASPAAIATLTRAAEKDGLAVQYRPLIRVGPSGRWEGWIEPASQSAWFASYYAAERPYLRDAARLRVAQFVAGTELHGINASPDWPGFLAQVRAAYPGVVGIAEHQSNYFHQHLVPVTAIGVDPYPDLGLADDATQTEVTAAWESLFTKIPATVRERTALDEVGIIAISGGYKAPQKWARRAAVHWQMQARWFTAACQAVARYHMTGIWFYELNLTINPDVANSFPGFFAQRAGARAISRCAAILRA